MLRICDLCMTSLESPTLVAVLELGWRRIQVWEGTAHVDPSTLRIRLSFASALPFSCRAFILFPNAATLAAHVKGSRRYLTWTYSVTTMDRMAAKRRKPKGERKDNDIRIRVTTEEKDAYNEEAKKQGRELSNWIRFVANEACGNGKSRGGE